MQNIKIIFGCFFFLFISFILSAEGSFNFSLTPFVALSYGRIHEYVFINNSDLSKYKLSQLDWDLMNVKEFGLKAAYTNSKINLEVQTNIALNNQLVGKMKDFDWLYYDGKLTDYSEHDCYLLSKYYAGITLQYFILNNIGLGIETSYKNTYFSAKNGYAQHGSDILPKQYWSSDMIHTSNYEGNTVVTYQVQNFTTQLGVVWQMEPIKSLFLNTSFWISPFQYTEAHDIHYQFSPNQPYNYFTDVVNSFFSHFEWDLTLGRKFIPQLMLYISTNLAYSPLSLGNTYIGQEPILVLNTYGGTSDITFKTQLGLTFLF